MKSQKIKDELLASVGQRVRTLRQQHEFTVLELAGRAALSQRFINQIEAGEANISIAKLAQVAAALGRSLPDLLTPGEHDQTLRARTWRMLNQCGDEDWHALHEWLAQRQQVPPSLRFIALIGLRGSGKSTVGPMLARQLKTGFVELDHWVEEAAGLSLAEIFTTHGELYFKKLEREALQKLFTTSAGCVFAPGGSIVNDEKSWKLIKQTCVTVWLHATPQEFMRRMLKAGETRLTGRPTVTNDLKALLARREPLYAESSYAIKTTGKSPTAVTSAILKLLNPNN